MFTITRILVCLALASSLCEGLEVENNFAGRLDDRIVGGVNVSIASYPYQLSLQYYNSHICGASIISPTWALSAAHCIVSNSPQLFTLRAGSTIRGSGGQIRQVTSMTTHPLWNNNTMNYDYALLQISTFSPFVYGTGVRNIVLPSFGVKENTVLTVTGWGTTSFGSNALTTNLMGVNVSVNNFGSCNWAYGNSLTSTMICASAPGKDSCQGDSGGPAATTINGITYLIGVTSFGNGCALAGYPGIYSNVSYVKSWITKTTGVL